MVYMGNIIKEHMDMKSDELICLMFQSDRRVFIEKNYILERCNGDLKITAEYGCKCYIDCAEVENMIIAKEKALKKGDD